MFLASPKNLLKYIIHCDFRAMKRMSLWVKAADTPDFTALEEHHRA
jgi:hypothetical protein